ncbi:hypothetical protein TNCV_3765651 [Trichonephila clavipes]|nr:hypothetical protein TNCV_3765651 [Trichonephila clavipes]
MLETSVACTWYCNSEFMSEYFAVPSNISDKDGTIKILKEKILFECFQDSIENSWKLTSPLIIFAAYETWDWTKKHLTDHLIRTSAHAPQCPNSQVYWNGHSRTWPSWAVVPLRLSLSCIPVYSTIYMNNGIFWDLKILQLKIRWGSGSKPQAAWSMDQMVPGCPRNIISVLFTMMYFRDAQPKAHWPILAHEAFKVGPQMSYKRRLNEDIENRVKLAASNFVYLSLAVDESPDRTSVSQLLVFVHETDKKFCVMKELLGMFPIKGQTTGSELLPSLIHLCNAASLNMYNCISITTDGAKSMIGTKMGMVMLLKERFAHCGVELLHYSSREFVVKN